MTPRILQGNSKESPWMLQGYYKGSWKHVKDNKRTSRTVRTKPKSSQTRLGLIRKHASAVGRRKGEDGTDQRTVPLCLDRKKERPEKISGPSKEEGSEPRCRGAQASNGHSKSTIIMSTRVTRSEARGMMDGPRQGCSTARPTRTSQRISGQGVTELVISSDSDVEFVEDPRVEQRRWRLRKAVNQANSCIPTGAEVE